VRLTAPLIAVAGAGALMVASATAAPVSPRHAPPAHMLVYAQEWSLWPSRTSVPSGRVVVQLWNRGQDAHDLRIRRVAHGRMVGRAQAAPVTLSGAVSQASWTLAPGRYELYCSMPGHRARGMHVLVRVR
jgi:hypothetical protein